MNRMPVVLLLILSLLLPAATPAQARLSTPSPNGLLMQTARWDDARLCPGSTLVFSLSFLNVSPADLPNYDAAITVSIPANTSYAGHSGDGVSHNSTANSIQWAFDVDPTQPGSVARTAQFSVTVNSTAVDGTQIDSLATGMLGGNVPVKAAASATVHCDQESEAPRNPVEFPQLSAQEIPTEAEETAPQLLASDQEDPLPGADSVLEAPNLGDEMPPGFMPFDLFLPAVVSESSGRSAAEIAQFGGPPGFGSGPVCDYVYPWVARHGMSEAVYQTDATEKDKAGFRPIAVSANGSGADTRFASLWIKDNKYGKNWSLRHNMTTAEYIQRVNDFKAIGLRPVVVDLYNTPADPRYAAIWIPENDPFKNEQALNGDAMQEKIDEHAAAGYRPVWVSGLGSSANNDPIFAGLWVRDSYTGTMRIGLTRSDISTEGIARTMVDQGFRLIHLSGYQTEDGIRYAAVWTRGGDCQDARWEGFRDMTSTEYQVKASAQRPVSSVKNLAAEAITLEPGDMGQTFRISRVSVTHNFNQSGISLARINAGAGVTFMNGDILVLQMEPGITATVNDRENGNISLRRPGYVGAKGQPFVMDDHQYRLVLQYQSGAGRWVELQRNNLSPDYYWPTSVDEFFDGDQRRYNSVWQAGKSQRTWRVTGKAALGDNLDAFDIAMQTFMQRRNIPNGSLALTVDGRLVLARGYSWDLPAVDAAEPDALFRTASVSKPLTAIGIMRLVQQRKLNLDWRLIDVPGFNAVLKSGDWTDQRIRNATVRDLLHHLGGWDRSDGVGDFMIMDWEVCKNHGPLATDRTKILNYGRTKKLDYAPGTTHFYSNFGYMLLGKIIETVSGQSYYNFMRDQVLTPSGAGASQIGGNFGGAKNEVRYYRPDNRMGGLVTGPSMIDPPPAYDPCNANHAFLTPVPYGNLNIPPMDAHGGWIASGVEMMKILRSLDNNTLLGPDLRREMWSQPDGRSRRMLAYDAGSGVYTDVTLALRATGGASVIPIDGIGDILIVGRGLNRFGRIDLNFTTPGDGYTLQVIYPSSEGGWKPLTGTDNTQSFTENGSMTFTAPLDWTVATLPMLDEHPRYYVMIYSTTVPTTAARIDRALPSGETTYSLGWDWSATQDTVRHTLRYQNRIGSLSVGSQVVGEISKATASIGADAPTDTKSGLLTIINLVGGPFYPGEKLLIGNNVVATAAERDWMMDANMRHGGLLWGTRATLQHRSNGVNWSILFNQDNAYDPYWYLPGEGGINGAIWNLVDEFVAENKWPAFDLFGQYP